MNEKTLTMLSINGKNLTSDLDRAGYRKMGVLLKTGHSFTDAELILKSDSVDVIVINFDYESVDGEQLCKHFKSNPETKNIPIVLTSVQGRPKRLNAEKNCFDLFVEQPVPRQFFIEKVRTLLERKTRETSRVSLESEVDFTYQDKPFSCSLGDLSKSGLLLSTDLKLEPGKQVDMTFPLPGYKKPIKVVGEIVRHITNGSDKNQVGIGVRFIDFQGDSQKRLEKYVSKSQDDDPKLAYYL